MRYEYNIETGERIELPDLPPTEVDERVIPHAISRKQFYMELAISGLILKTEATSALTVGILPASLQSIVDGMSNADAQWEAQCQLLGANDFYRGSPWVLVVATVLGWTDDQIDDFWIRAEKH